jgi:hypothetical protein
MNKMQCSTAQNLMLEADIGELRGEGTSELAHHIAGCSGCRNHAQRIIRGYGDLEQGLGTFAQKRRRNLRHAWIPVPLAAAAVLAFLMMNREAPLPDMGYVTARMFAQPAVVTPPADKQAIVIEKNDLTVVWLY